MERHPGGVLYNHRLHLLLLALLGLAAYSNTFTVPFLFDDRVFIKNLTGGVLSDIPRLFIEPSGSFGSRPLLNATLALNHRLGGLDPRGYHAVNLSLHLANGMLLYFLVVMTGRHMRFGEEETRLTAALSSLIFVLHPAQTEAVTNIIGRSMLLSTAFYFSGTILFLKAVTADRHRGLYIGGLFIVSLLGMASRENFVTFPLMLFLYDLLFVSRFSLSKVTRHWKAYLPALLALGYLAFIVTSHTYKLYGGYRKGIPPFDYVLTEFNVHWTYLRLLLLPVNQNVDYDYPLAGSPLELPTIFSFSGYLGLWAGSILLARRRPVAAFGVLWFLLALTPVSFLVALSGVSLGDVIFEHRLYLPSAGLFVLASAAVPRLRVMPLPGRAVVATAAAIVLVLGGAAYARNSVWSDGISLWSDAIKKSPRKARGYNNLAASYGTIGNIDRAIETLETALRVEPDVPEVHYNLGVLYADGGVSTGRLNTSRPPRG